MLSPAVFRLVVFYRPLHRLSKAFFADSLFFWDERGMSMRDREERVVVYIDGFNLYYGIRETLGSKYLWLDLASLSPRLLRPDQRLVTIKYFTARMRKPPEKRKRQSDYLEAVGSTIQVEILYGRYQRSLVECRICRRPYVTYTEKMTDVRMAVELLGDVCTNLMNTALIVTGDADLVPAIEKVKSLFPDKRVEVAFPPGREHNALKSVASAYIVIGEDRLLSSQFPEQVPKADGFVLTRPTAWT
ncbi:MAG: NYN domain-containing protein [Armatimonadetes bacterium CG07_land_8_20_14_0_80_59_28]